MSYWADHFYLPLLAVTSFGMRCLGGMTNEVLRLDRRTLKIMNEIGADLVPGLQAVSFSGYCDLFGASIDCVSLCAEQLRRK